ncbi:MAG TPA: tRNA lysidine(34) synthetase TilS [Candidatus Acidoferrales bacterium]|nr:tRNA lysidine(34) synthetase TilS [Candidatus Acidoferrales bacterium]
MSDLLQRIDQNILNRRLLKRGQAVLVAVSGGLDSMTLLQLLRKLAMWHKWKLTVVHFNHQLRGRSSDADESLVRRTAAALKLPFAVGRADVRKFAKMSKLSIEMAARKLRHEFYARTARERSISTVALAHHADDQVELFFLRVLRGAGGEGLAGMKRRSLSPVDGKITLIRPLLDVPKAELREFAQENKIQFREDGTNARLDLPRNRVRHELLPLLRRQYQPALTRTILRLMEIVGAEAKVIGEAAQQWLKTNCRNRGDGAQVKIGRRQAKGGKSETPHVVSHCFEKLPVAVQRRVLQLQLVELGVWADFDLVERLRRTAEILIAAGPGFSVSRDAAGTVELQTQAPMSFRINELTINLADRAGEVEFEGVQFHWNFVNRKTAINSGRRTGREFFDADKIGGRITLRHWRAGDRFQPIGLKSAVKLQDLFTNRKIPRARRHHLVVAETDEGKIFWVQGLRMSEPFKLTPATKRRLVWRWRCGSS